MGGGGGLRAHAQRRRIVPSCSDGVKSADSIIRQSAAYALGQYKSNILVSGLFLGLSYNDIFVKKMTMPTGKMAATTTADAANQL